MLDWLLHNKTWLFSGVGVALAALIYRAVRPSPSDKLAKAQLKDRERASHPFFRWSYIDSDNAALTYNFQNEGGAVSDLYVRTTTPFDALIYPSDLLQSQGVGYVRFVSQDDGFAFPIRFEIHYKSSLGYPESKAFSTPARSTCPRSIE
jgi:hypothetical protein